VSAGLDPWPGGEGCPLERWRRRLVARAAVATLLAAFAVAFGIVIWSLT
jgi:hypothetical protein